MPPTANASSLLRYKALLWACAEEGEVGLRWDVFSPCVELLEVRTVDVATEEGSLFDGEPAEVGVPTLSVTLISAAIGDGPPALELVPDSVGELALGEDAEDPDGRELPAPLIFPETAVAMVSVNASV